MFNTANKLDQTLRMIRDELPLIHINFITESYKQKYYDLNEHSWKFEPSLLIIDIYLTLTDKRDIFVGSPKGPGYNLKSLPLWTELVQPWLDGTLSKEDFRAWLEANPDKYTCN